MSQYQTRSLRVRRTLTEKLLAGSREAGVLRVVPKDVGDRTMDLVETEVGVWSRLRNRKQANSYTGPCSGERSTGGKRRQGGIDRQGNGRIREPSGLITFQPQRGPSSDFSTSSMDLLWAITTPWSSTASAPP